MNNDKIIHLALFNERLHHAIMTHDPQHIRELLNLDPNFSIGMEYIHQEYQISIGTRPLIQRLL